MFANGVAKRKSDQLRGIIVLPAMRSRNVGSPYEDTFESLPVFRHNTIVAERPETFDVFQFVDVKEQIEEKNKIAANI